MVTIVRLECLSVFANLKRDHCRTGKVAQQKALMHKLENGGRSTIGFWGLGINHLDVME